MGLFGEVSPDAIPSVEKTLLETETIKKGIEFRIGNCLRPCDQSENASVDTNSLIFAAISSSVSSAVSSPLRDARRGLSSRRSS